MTAVFDDETGAGKDECCGYNRDQTALSLRTKLNVTAL